MANLEVTMIAYLFNYVYRVADVLGVTSENDVAHANNGNAISSARFAAAVSPSAINAVAT